MRLESVRRKLFIPSLLALVAGGDLAVPANAAAQGRTDTIEVFAPHVISTDSGDSFSTLSPDGREFYFTRHRPDWSGHRIMVSRLVGEKWTAPTQLPFSGTYNDREPKLSPDGRRLWFSSNRPVGRDTARRSDLDLWYVERNASGTWGKPQHPGAPVNGVSQDFCPVVTANGTLYFISNRAGVGDATHHHGVWRARYIHGAYEAPEPLGPGVNTGYETNVYITPDEHLLFLSRDEYPDGLGGDDLYGAAWRGDAWSPVRNLGAPFNTAQYEYGPLLSPDMKWLYFTSHRSGAADIFRAPMSLVTSALGAAEAREGVRRADLEGVRTAALDYVEGFYEGDTTKIIRSVRTEISKYGFDLPKDKTMYVGEAMTYQEMIDYTKRVKARNRPVNPAWPKIVTILDVEDQTAAAKVTAWWGTDYLLLAKYDGKWMIRHILWQSPPQ